MRSRDVVWTVWRSVSVLTFPSLCSRHGVMALILCLNRKLTGAVLDGIQELLCEEAGSSVVDCPVQMFILQSLVYTYAVFVVAVSCSVFCSGPVCSMSASTVACHVCVPSLFGLTCSGLSDVFVFVLTLSQ